MISIKIFFSQFRNILIKDNVAKFCQPGESGGNVHVVCNQIINGQKWAIVSDGGNGSDCYKWTKEEFEKFIANLNVFLSSVNEEKKLMDILEKEKFLSHYVENENQTGQDIIKQLVAILSNSTETRQGETSEEGLEWLQTFLAIAKSISEEECWTPKLQLLTKETCKRFLLPETEIEYKEEHGKEIVFITGVVIYVSKMMTKMVEFKVRHTDNKTKNVQKVKIVALQSVHIDCNLDNDTWHGINIDIVTDKLIVDGEVCWDVSGKTATINSSMRGETKI